MASQHGVASSVQARQCGVSRSVERRLIAEGALVEPHRGVVATGGVRPTFQAQAMAAALCSGVQAVSHGSAARLHRLHGFVDYPVIDVIAVRGRRLRLRHPLVAHVTRGPIAEQLVWIGAIPVTSMPLTLVQVTTFAPRQHVEAALVEALRRGVPAATIRAVAVSWRRAGRRGPGELIELLDQVASSGPIISSAATHGSS
jgi:hypothetical protein